MTEEEICFYKREKSRFDELLGKLQWTEESLFNEQETMIRCPLDRNHRFPIGSNHVQNCQLVREGFSKDYFKEVAACEQENDYLINQGFHFPPSVLSQILQRPIAITNDLPLNTEQTTVLFTPSERSLIAEAVHREALRLGIIPSTPSPAIADNCSDRSRSSNLTEQLNKLAELRDQKRRRTKYVTRTRNKSFYDIARDLIHNEMELPQQQNSEQLPHEQHRKKHKHRSSRSDSRKHHRHSKNDGRVEQSEERELTRHSPLPLK